MSQTRQSGLAAALKAARSGNSPSTPTPSSHGTASRTTTPLSRKVVRTSSLRSQVPYLHDSPSAFQFFNDPDVLLSTPVEEGREEEYAEHLAYASNYSADLLRFLRASGFKDTVGYTFDNTDAEADFNILLSGLRHVLSPINYREVAKLLDVEHDYAAYHVTVNELLFTVLPSVLRGNALSLYHEVSLTNPGDGRFALHRLRYEVEGVPDPDTDRFWLKIRSTIIDETTDPAPQLAVIRALGDKHMKINVYPDSKRMQDLWHVLADSAKASPHTAPLYLVVLRELRAGTQFTFASLCLRIRTAWRDEAKHSILSDPPPAESSSPGSGYSRPKHTDARMYAFGEPRSATPLKGEWVADAPNALFRRWSGTGFPCMTCFRMWGMTDAHPDTKGVCPYACAEAFAPGRVPAAAVKAAARPAPPGSIATSPAASATAAPKKPPSAAAMHVSLPDDSQPAAVELAAVAGKFLIIIDEDLPDLNSSLAAAILATHQVNSRALSVVSATKQNTSCLSITPVIATSKLSRLDDLSRDEENLIQILIVGDDRRAMSLSELSESFQVSYGTENAESRNSFARVARPEAEVPVLFLDIVRLYNVTQVALLYPSGALCASATASMRSEEGLWASLPVKGGDAACRCVTWPLWRVLWKVLFASNTKAQLTDGEAEDSGSPAGDAGSDRKTATKREREPMGEAQRKPICGVLGSRWVKRKESLTAVFWGAYGEAQRKPDCGAIKSLTAVVLGATQVTCISQWRLDAGLRIKAEG
ncbi:hypothetical protein CYMTET_18987 [Cymbomonas tetramitiformis]|uniref:Uncharacterized protein n=1 Tax=Cymbomonas tetramitiformis TaxID=36881 RepID=A0AAE0G702_9CHLO|nr:hypothetical protein CYMTET_18987 [Cymbomonas tetramitiformis]